jgi:hypothetical protein
MADDFQMGDARAMPLWDIGQNQAVFIRWKCGRVGQYGPGALQRLHRLPSDTLIYDFEVPPQVPEVQLAGQLRGQRRGATRGSLTLG